MFTLRTTTIQSSLRTSTQTSTQTSLPVATIRETLGIAAGGDPRAGARATGAQGVAGPIRHG